MDSSSIFLVCSSISFFSLLSFFSDIMSSSVGSSFVAFFCVFSGVAVFVFLLVNGSIFKSSILLFNLLKLSCRDDRSDFMFVSSVSLLFLSAEFIDCLSFSRSSLNTASFSFTSVLSNDSISSFVNSSMLSIFADWLENRVILLSSSVNSSSVFAAMRPVYLSVSFIFDILSSMFFETLRRLSRLLILSICSRNSFICLFVSEDIASSCSCLTIICIISRSFLSRSFLIISGCISSAMASIFLKPVSISL